jgi:cysteine-S-conjugate beta-lyase
MRYNFDQIIDRRCSDSGKWNYYDPDVLPVWVADMDFLSPEPVIRALRARVEHGCFGYGTEPAELREIVVSRLKTLYDWTVQPEDLIFLPGVVTAFNLACNAVGAPGDGVLIQTPVYPPFLTAPANAGLRRDEMELTRGCDGRYSVDFDAFEAAIQPSTRIFLFCSPHNPVGRVFTRAELERTAEICQRHNLVICSDDIHCDLVFAGYRHIPIASLDASVAQRTITLIAPSKTYNIAGLECSVAIIQNADLRKQFQAARKHLVGGPNIMGFVAALAAYRDGQEWLDQCLSYLEGNYNFLMRYVAEQLPGISMSPMEGTFLSWLDCRQAGIAGNPFEFFMSKARVGLNDGCTFGRGGEGFVRLNFACPRPILVEALDKMRAALRNL